MQEWKDALPFHRKESEALSQRFCLKYKGLEVMLGKQICTGTTNSLQPRPSTWAKHEPKWQTAEK